MPIARNAILAPRSDLFVDPAHIAALDHDLTGRGAFASMLTTGLHAKRPPADTLGKAIDRANVKSVLPRFDPAVVVHRAPAGTLRPAKGDRHAKPEPGSD